MEDIKVSILCTAYNHEKYIRKALESFVNQKTSFKYEVIVNDDCSTDGTAAIIKEFEDKYPDIIKPIYQKVNQFSKCQSLFKEVLFPKAKGKYIATCEGDDYWVDEYKLQKQYDALENNKDCSFCFTNGIVLEMKTGEQYDFLEYLNVSAPNKKIQYKEKYNLGEFLDNFAFVPTASFMFPAINYSKFPDSFDVPCFGGDRKLSVYSAALGNSIFINDKTCVYRYNVPGSAMTESKKRGNGFFRKLHEGHLHLYEYVNDFSNYKYSKNLNFYIERSKYLIISSVSRKRDFFKKENRMIFKEISFKRKIMAIINVFFPITKEIIFKNKK